MSKEKGGRGRRSIEEDSIQRDQEIKAAVRLHINRDPAIAMVREFEEILEELARHAEEIGLQLQLEYPNLNCIQHKCGRG